MSGGAAARMKGIRWERACAKFYGTATTRSTRPGVHEDGGDIVLPGWVVEAKDHDRWQVQRWFEDTEAKCVGDERPVLLLKRRNLSTSYGLVVVRMGDIDLSTL
jgi:hypothetical protein